MIRTRNFVNMKKLLILLPLLASCKTTKHEDCDAYGSTIVFDPQHLHAQNGNYWHCYEFPADTLVIK